MNSYVTIEELKNIIALKDLPEELLHWILENSMYEEHEDGELIIKKDDVIDHLWMLVEGKINFFMDVNGKLVYYFTFENNELSGGIGGLLPYSRMRKSPGNTYAVGKVRTIKLHKNHFQEMERLSPEFTQRLIGYMTERARFFATVQLQHEKVSALGKLAAGIAHELNNPAAAIDRISEELDKRLKLNFELTEELLKHNLPPELIHNIREMIQSKGKARSAKIKVTPLQRMAQEDQLNGWLSDNGLNCKREVAETFIEAGVSAEDLEKLQKDAGKKALTNVFDWLENLLSSELIIKDLEEASWRITMLVGAIKSHVRMDRAMDIHKTDIHTDIENTLTLLGYKLREKNIMVKKNFHDEIPEVEAFSGELNQIWTNIIDNAIYAMPQNGELIINTKFDKKNVAISITDNGSGIPKEIISRIYDPFFTTKKVGDGTGIGLDIVQQIIRRHSAEIKVSSVPGKTEFTVILPVSQQAIKSDIKNETPIHSDN